MRFFALLFLLVLTTKLNAQATTDYHRSWGLYNGYYKHFDELKTWPLSPARRQDTVHYQQRDHQRSIGLFWREELSSGRYRQIDILEVNQYTFSQQTGIYNPNYGDQLDIIEGEEITGISFRSAFQVGKCFPLLPRLYADAGLRISAWYERKAVNSLDYTAFDREITYFGSALALEFGLFYRIAKRFQLGYHIIPFAATAYSEKTYIDNPIVVEAQRVDKQMKFRGEVFESVLDFRNIHLSYLF